MNDGAATDGAVIDEIFALAKAAISSAEPRTRGQDPGWAVYESIDIAYDGEVFSIRSDIADLRKTFR